MIYCTYLGVTLEGVVGMKKVISALLTVVLLLSTVAVPLTMAETDLAGEYGVNYVKYGDVDYDSQISAADALKVLQAVVGKVQFDEHQTNVADVDGDSKVAASDALQILQFVVGKITSFSVGEYYTITPVEEPPIPVDPDQEAANAVIKMIEDVPPPISLAAKDEIAAIRAAFDALTDAQKALVTNYDALVGFEAEIERLENSENPDREAADAVIDLIDALPYPPTLADKNQVLDARAAYNLLTDTQKALVTNYLVLLSIEKALAELEIDPDKQAADAVITLINKIPANPTLADKNAVLAARSAYQALTDTQKALVVNLQVLVVAEKTLSELGADPDQRAAAIVMTLINNIPADVKLSDETRVKAARLAYSRLTQDQQALVTNFQTLADAEKTIAEIKATNADKAIADGVIALIDAIPATVTLNDKAKVQAARDAYDDLTDTQKDLVVNYQKLVAAEKAIVDLEKTAADQAAADGVIALIKAIPSNVTLDDADKVETARTAYEALTDTQKALVTNYQALLNAEEILAATIADKAAADHVIALIDAIPTPVALRDKDAITAARTAFGNLTDTQSALVSNYQKLVDAEASIIALEKEAADKAAAKAVQDKIDALPATITLDSKSAVEAARADYNSLTDEQKPLVTNYQKLLDAESTIAALEEAAVNQAAAQKVVDQIAALPVAITLDDKSAVTAARSAYNALTDAQKALVTNLAKLQEAEATIAALEAGDPPHDGNIATYDKSNSVNGAYEKDATADTSFMTTTSGVKANTMYRLTAPALRNPDGSGVGDSDFARLVYSMQGLVNRDFGLDADHTALIAVVTETSDTTWLSEMTQNGSIMQYANAEAGINGLSEVKVTNFNALLDEFLPLIKSCGIILWDGNVPATANVAATICGLDGFLPVLANSPLHTLLVNKGVPVKQSLVGMFKNGQKGTAITGTATASTGSAKNDAYLWALEKYFNRCSSQYLAYTLDGAPTIKGYSAYADHPTALLEDAGTNCLTNHDYLIARRCFFFDLAPYNGEAACDDPAQKNGQATAGTDNATMLKIFAARYARANGAFGALMGFPPWWCKYTSHAGQGSKADTWVEWLYCEYITAYNMAKEADAKAPASMTNGSLFYKYVPMKDEYVNNHTPLENIGYDKNTYYYTIYVGDYDSSAWLKEHIYKMWINRGGDKKRGTLPLMWSINPNLSDRVPVIFDYMYDNMTAQDYLVGGDGGAGYIIPEGLFQDKTLSYSGMKRPYASGGGVFAAYSKKYYDRFGMEMTGFIINGNHFTATANIADCISRYSPKLNFTHMKNTLLGKYGSTYFINCHVGVGTNDNQVMYDHAVSTRNSGYNFSAYRTVCKTPTEISNIVNNFNTYAAQKGLSVKYVDPYTYYNLLQASGQGANLGTPSAPSNPTTPTPNPYIPPDPNVLINFDSVSGFIGHHKTNLAIETNNKKEGLGALRMDFEAPTANASSSQIGGMIVYEFGAPVDLSADTEFSIEYWLTDAISGSAGLQINFVTNGTDDGFNFMQGIDNAQPGWHTLTFKKSHVSTTTNGANWSSIRAIRITYFNYANNAKPTFMMLDNLRRDAGDSSTNPPVNPDPVDPTPSNPTQTVLVPFDTTNGVTAEFETTVSTDSTNKTEGSGALRMTYAKPNGNASSSKIGGMAYYEFINPANLSTVTEFKIDYYVGDAVGSSAGLQINFVTNGKDDGFNFMQGIDNAQPGWHTLTFTKDHVSATANGANWSSIRAIRFTYFNYLDTAKPDYIIIDNLRVTANGTITVPPAASAAGAVLLNFDSIDNIIPEFNTTATAETTQKTEGSGSVRLDYAYPTGQNGQVGGMMYYTFPSAVDLSAAETFTLDYYTPVAIVGSAMLQVNFVTNGNDDGFNFNLGIDNATAGWHTLTINKANPNATANTPDWASIKRIRITYFNLNNNETPTYMILDNLRQIGEGTTPTPTPDPDPTPEDTTPAASDPDAILTFDSTSGFSGQFSTTFVVDTANKQEGVGSLKTSFGQPTAEAAGSKIGGMIYYDFASPVDLSTAQEFALSYYTPAKINGSTALQVNFITNGNDDGYNFTLGIDDAAAGWHTLTFNKANPSATANNPNWASINRIRITYFNMSNNAEPTYMLLDNLKIAAKGTTPEPDPEPEPEPTPTTVDTVMIGFNSTAGVTAEFSTTVSIEANNKNEGSGALRMDFGKPTGEASGSQIGGMIYYEFANPINLSAVEKFQLDYWLTDAIKGSAGLQINFVTNGKDDGFNFMQGIDDAQSGWHTLSFLKSHVSATTNGANWASIRAIRVTYFNYANNTTPTFMMLDNFRITTATDSVPAIPGPASTTNATVISNFDSITGVSTAFSATAALTTTNKTEGSGAVQLTLNNPTAESAGSKIGGMMYYTFTAPMNLSAGKTITLDYYVNGNVGGSAGLQVNFVTNGKDDGFNYMIGMDNKTTGWHTATFDLAAPPTTANNANWSNIVGIRVTYFNYDNLTTLTVLALDNMKLVS